MNLIVAIIIFYYNLSLIVVAFNFSKYASKNKFDVACQELLGEMQLLRNAPQAGDGQRDFQRNVGHVEHEDLGAPNAAKVPDPSIIVPSYDANESGLKNNEDVEDRHERSVVHETKQEND